MAAHRITLEDVRILKQLMLQGDVRPVHWLLGDSYLTFLRAQAHHNKTDRMAALKENQNVSVAAIAIASIHHKETSDAIEKSKQSTAATAQSDRATIFGQQIEKTSDNAADFKKSDDINNNLGLFYKI
jgi:hypothetical protein